jgi:hypothetical protein
MKKDKDAPIPPRECLCNPFILLLVFTVVLDLILMTTNSNPEREHNSAVKFFGRPVSVSESPVVRSA